jgi:sec-independent protein translocase protein TatB
MLPEAGALELLFLAGVALIVVGPKDLPVLMRKVGQWVGKMRALAAEFRSSFDELARQSELDELRKEVEALRNMRDPLTNVHPTFDEVSAGLDPSGFRIDDGSTYHEAVGLAHMDLHTDVERSYPAVGPEDVAEPKKAKPKPRRKTAAAKAPASKAKTAAKAPAKAQTKAKAPAKARKKAAPVETDA